MTVYGRKTPTLDVIVMVVREGGKGNIERFSTGDAPERTGL
jgi:hypothetical protein